MSHGISTRAACKLDASPSQVPRSSKASIELESGRLIEKERACFLIFEIALPIDSLGHRSSPAQNNHSTRQTPPPIREVQATTTTMSFLTVPRTPSGQRATYFPLSRYYLLAYNFTSMFLWAVCTLHAAINIPLLAPKGHLPAIFTYIYTPLLTTTQSLAVLEILHSLFGIVRAPLLTTTMQVSSRLLLVWGVMYPFRDRGDGRGGIVGGDYEYFSKGVTATGLGPGAKLGDLAFLGCLAAWGVTECIRYGFFGLQVWGKGVPSWWIWLR